MANGLSLETDAVLSRTRPLSTTRRRFFYKAPEFEQRLPSCQEVGSGETVRLECIIDAIPKPTIRWFKDGEDVTDDDRFTYEQDGDYYVIIIEDVGKEDEGTYKVKASNKEGETSSVSYLEVKGKRKKKPKHVRSVSVPVSFPTIAEVTNVEDEEERELEEIAPSPLSRRLRSTRGSLRKEHTWPRVLKALPNECVAYVAEATTESEKEYEGTEEESDDSPEAICTVPIPDFSNHIVLEPAETYEYVQERVTSPVVRSPEEELEIQRARDIWRELERLNQAEKLGLNIDDVAESQAGESNCSIGFEIFDTINSVTFGGDAASTVEFYTIALPLSTFFGLVAELSPTTFILCILVMSFLRYAVIVYLATT